MWRRIIQDWKNIWWCVLMHAIKDLEEYVHNTTAQWDQGGVRDRTIGQVKMQKEHHGPDEATWELEDAMQLAHYFCLIL